MQLRNRRRLSLEQLEDRWCPTLTLVALDGAGNLVVSGTPTSDALTFNFTAQDQIEVLDGVTSLGTFNVPGNLRVTLGNKISVPGVTVSLDMNGFGLSGNANLNLGNVFPTGYAVDDGDLGGTISGNLSVTTGAGLDSLTLDSGTTVNGNLSFNAGASSDNMVLDGVATIGGNVTATKVNSFSLGITTAPSTVDGNVILNAAGENVFNNYFFSGSTTDRSAVAGSVIVTTGNGPIDLVFFGGTIGGNLIANLGQGLNILTLDSSEFLLGNFSYVGGSGVDVVNFASGVGSGAVVLGNVSVSAGNGANTFTMDTGTIIGGSNITYVGGNNIDTLTFNANAPGATLHAILGAGDDLVTFGSTTLARADIDFGAGADILLLNVPALNFPLSFRNL